MTAPFSTRLAAALSSTGTSLCVGIDPHPDRLPLLGRSPAEAALWFGRQILAAADGLAPAIKPQFAFFEALGPEGMRVLALLLHEARERGLLVVGDAKRGDIGTTAAAYARATLGPGAPFPCDALTVSPFLGPDTLEPFVDVARAEGRGLFVLLRTSNPGSAAFQLPVLEALAGWIEATNLAHLDATGFGLVGAVVGATKGGEVEAIRARIPHAWMLLPGYGAQGAAAENTRAAFRADGLGALIPASRAATLPEPNEVDAWSADAEGWIRSRIQAIRADLARVVPLPSGSGPAGSGEGDG